MKMTRLYPLALGGLLLPAIANAQTSQQDESTLVEYRMDMNAEEAEFRIEEPEKRTEDDDPSAEKKQNDEIKRRRRHRQRQTPQSLARAQY